MYRYFCRECGCRLDPGEGNTCDECWDKYKQEQVRRQEVDRMILATDYKQMEMEEFIHG